MPGAWTRTLLGAADGPAFAKGAGHGAALGDVQKTIDRPEDLLLYTCTDGVAAYPSASSRACSASSRCIASCAAQREASR